MPTNNECHDKLEAEVEGKLCRKCRLIPQVAWYQGDFHIRCDCGYDEAELMTPKYQIPTAISKMQDGRRRRRQ
jgi:hypothetical protein